MTPADRPTTDHGSAGFCTDHGQAAPDERVETVAQVEALAERIETAMTDDGHRMPRSDETRYLAYVAAGVAAAVVAALDDETEALTEARDDWAKVAGERADQRDAARAALDRVRALHKPVWDGARDDYRCAECGAALNVATPDCPSIAAALDPEEPR